MKRINFKKVIVKNFLSVGEEPVQVEFTKGLHVITGNNKDKPDRRNAIGKSTIADSIYFAIFGETLREIKKDLIPNNITGGKTHVELDFDVVTPNGINTYSIVRNLSPTKVQVYENGIDKTRDSINNTTKYICDVLSASPSIFQNCVIMTVNNAIPFMAKSKIDKRKFIEDIFGLEVFSTMVSQIRSEYNDIKRDFDNQQTKLTEIERQYKGYIDQKQKILDRRAEKRQLYAERKNNNTIEREQLLEEINNMVDISIDDINIKITDYEVGLEKCNDIINETTAEIAVGKQQISNYKDLYLKIGTSEEQCPVCLRSIEEHDISYIKQEKDKIKQDIEQAAANIKLKITQVDKFTQKRTLIKQKITELNNEIKRLSLMQLDKANKHERVRQLVQWLEELEVDLNAEDNSETDIDEIIKETSGRIVEITTDTEKYRAQLAKLDIVKYIASEEGVKSYIVNKLLDLLNSRLLHYLQRLDSNSICIFNEYFEEEILNEKNKVCSYFNFSGAERKAIDLACLFTFSDLRRMQGGVQYNIAIYDELFDSSFDEKGIDLITTILKDRVVELDECAIVISHRKESIKAVTGDVIFLEKENGITRRLEYSEMC